MTSHVPRLISQPSCPIELSHIWKRYSLGARHDSLRDSFAELMRRLAGRNGHLPKDEFWALKDVSFSVQQGEALGIIGPNGAGKSTILKLLSRISKQTKGDIHVKGRLAALIEVGAGFHQDLTGRENIYLNGTILGLRRRDIDRLFDSIVAFSELEKFLDLPVKRYSSGMTVRLGFAVAAHIHPENLLIDEVLAVGDLAFQHKCYEQILELKAKGTTIVFISHKLDAVQRLCDRVILLNEGQIVREGEPNDVIAYYRQEVLRRHRFARKASMRKKVTQQSAALSIEGLQVLNENGQPMDAFETGQPLRIQLSYLAHRPVTDPSVTVTIERLDGLICHEASTRLSGVSWIAWSGPGSLTLDYSELNLLPNTYQVTVQIYEGKNPTPLAHLRNQHFFHITSKEHTSGTVSLNHRWKLQESAP